MVKFSIQNLSVWYGEKFALKHLSLDVEEHEILTAIGPSNSGKTTFLRSLNRLNEINPGFRQEGTILLDGEDIDDMPVEEVRRRAGMVFALPLPLPLSIYENVAYGPRMKGVKNRNTLDERVESSLKQAYLWEEVKGRLNDSAFMLSGGQQQRLCIARTLAVEPDVVLFDEPCSGLDPVSTARVEEAMLELKQVYTIILVTNNVKQAARVGDRTAFFLNGELIELDSTDTMFTAPHDTRTDDYIRGKFG